LQGVEVTLLRCLLVSAALLCPAVPDAPAVEKALVTRMIAGRYDLGVMRRVAKKRGIPWVVGQCGMAIDGPGIGARVRVTGVRTGVTRVCTVIDVSQTIDLKRHQKARLVELDANSALAICSRRFFLSRAKECPVDVTVLRKAP